MSKKTRKQLPLSEQVRHMAHDLAEGKTKPGEVAEQLGERGWNVRLRETDNGFDLSANVQLKPGEEPRIPPS